VVLVVAVEVLVVIHSITEGMEALEVVVGKEILLLLVDMEAVVAIVVV
jgi:hypothetical protein